MHQCHTFHLASSSVCVIQQHVKSVMEWGESIRNVGKRGDEMKQAQRLTVPEGGHH